jgi:hypothetical protein
MATTYTLISSVTVGSGGAATIGFTSIPSTYTDLVLKTSLRTDRALEIDAILFTLNASTSNFTGRRLFGDGSSVTSDTVTRIILIANAATSTSTTFSNNEIYIPNYAGSTNKSYSIDGVAENNATFARADLTAGLWSDTSAITSITLTPNIGPNFIQYSTAYLYGISNA